MTFHFSCVHLVSLWQWQLLSAGWGQVSLQNEGITPLLKAVVLVSHLLQPDRATGLCLWWGSSRSRPPFPSAGITNRLAFFSWRHPVVIAAWCHQPLPAEHQHIVPISICLHLSWFQVEDPRTKPLMGWKSCVQPVKPSSHVSMLMSPADRSVCDTAQAWQAQPRWPGWAVAPGTVSVMLDLRAMLGKATCPRSHAQCLQQWRCSLRWCLRVETRTFPVMFPMQSPGISWSPSPNLLTW